MIKSVIMKKKRYSKSDWLKQALEILSAEGEQKIRIEKLAVKLGVTKGSFYYHFSNREDFIRNLVQYWADSSTAVVIERMKEIRGDPKDRLLTLMYLLFNEEAAKYDVAVRAWAGHEPYVAPIVQKVDEMRYEYVRSLFNEMGFQGDELEMRTITFVVFHSMDSGLYFKSSKKERQKLIELRHSFFTRP